MASTSALNVERFLADKRTPFCSLDCEKAFEQLRYATSYSSPNVHLQLIDVQLEGKEIRASHLQSELGRCPYHPRPMDSPGNIALRPPHSHLVGQWEACRSERAKDKIWAER